MLGNYMIDSWCDEIDQEYELKRMALEQKLYKERMQRYDQKCRVGKRYPVCDHLKDMILEEVSQHGKHPASALADNGFLTDNYEKHQLSITECGSKEIEAIKSHQLNGNIQALNRGSGLIYEIPPIQGLVFESLPDFDIVQKVSILRFIFLILKYIAIGLIIVVVYFIVVVWIHIVINGHL